MQDLLLALLKPFCSSQLISDAQVPDTPLLCCGWVFIVQRDWKCKQHNLDTSAFCLSAQWRNFILPLPEMFRLFSLFLC